MERGYNVVFKNISPGTHTGVFTWSSFKDKKEFDKWNNEKMKSWYQVVAEGVTSDRAVELCSTPEANQAAMFATGREIEKLADSISNTISSILKEGDEVGC